MRFDRHGHRRRPNRAPEYDYGSPGAYFVTICTKGRECVFGTVIDDTVRLTEAGEIVSQVWYGLPERFPSVELDAFVVMPNHIHAIVIIVGAQFIAPAASGSGTGAMNRAPTLGEIVRTFKAASTRLIRTSTNPAFAWQRNYYDHIIRDEPGLDRIRDYIAGNPGRWLEDALHPSSR